MSSLPTTLRALTSRTGLRRTLLAYALFDLVEFSIWLAIILYAYGRGGARLAGLAAVVQLLPAAVLAPLLASIGDRMPRGTALAMAHAGVAAATLLTDVAVLTHAPAVLVIAASTTATTAVAVVRPIHFAALPQLADTADDLVSANSLSSGADGVGLFVGPILAGLGEAFSGAWVVLSSAALAASIAMALTLRLRLAPPPVAAADEPEGWRAALEGVRALRGDWGSLALLLVLSVGFVLAGALDVLGVAFSELVLHRGQTGAGLIVGAIGIGVALGAMAASFVSGRRRLTPVIVTVGVAQGLAFALVSTMGELLPAMAAIALVGAADALLLVSGRTLLQRAIDDRVLARVFAVQEGASLLGLALGAGLVPLLIGWLSPARAFVPLGLAAVAVVGLTSVLIGRLDARAVFRPRELALLRGVAFLSALPAFELERLAKNARWMEVDAGEDVVRQGDIGDRFFIIGIGVFDVTVDGVLRPSPLGPGVGFGEIALLRSVPRTATVTARTPGRLLAVTAADFLAAVTGSESGHALAAEVASAHLARDRTHDS